MPIEDPGPREDPSEEPSHPWAHVSSSQERSLQSHKEFDWDEERARQKEEGSLYIESYDDRIERERSILP